MKSRATNPIKAPDESKDPYDVWKRHPTQANMSRAVASLDPVIGSAMTTYGGRNISPLLRGRARILTAGAIRSYDPVKGASLKSHVMLQLQPLGRYSNRAAQPVSIPEQRMRQVAGLSKAEQDFYERHGRDPTDDELADRLGLSVRRLASIRRYALPTVRTDAFGPGAVDPTTNRPDPMDVWIDYVYHDLDPTDRKILEWKLGRGGKPVLLNVEIARRLKISPAAVSQRAARLQAKLLENMETAA